MSKIIIAYLIIRALSFELNKSKDCNLLPNGFYKLEYISPFKVKSQIKIEKGRFFEYRENGDTIKGRMNWIYNCIFIFDYDNKAVDTNSIQKFLSKSFGPSCIELSKKSGDTTFFRTTFTGNLEIETNDGYFIKIN
jgi:hypothetical protein